jgi:hypothetical protein
MWTPGLLADITTGKKLNAILIYFPTPLKTPKVVNIPTGINIRGLKVELVAGGRSTRLIGLGLQVGTKDKQFMRMDIGGAHPKHGNLAGTGAMPIANDELAVWDDLPFHFHVMQYAGESNK